MFEADYEKLNKEQKTVVDEREHNLLVLAPAGTGKTKVIAMRTARLIEGGIEPNQLLCLTFTNKAAKEMKERIQLYLPKEGKEILVKTFHSFCYYLICHEKEASHFSFPCTIIDEADSLEIVKKIIHQNGLNDDHLYYPLLLTFFENVKRYALSLPVEERYEWNKVIRKFLAESKGQYHKSDAFIRQFGLKIFNTYTRYLRENNSIDFMDIVMEAKYLLEQEEIACKWQNYFKVIQVDEMQDTSVREYEIIKLLGEKAKLSLYGDFNQTIYEWRGSNPVSMIETYRKDFNPTDIHLQLNYRSTQVLLGAANDYIRNSKLYPSLCHAHSVTTGEKIELLEAANQADEINFLAHQVKESLTRTKQVAVLTRTNQYAKEIADTFTKAGISCSVIEDTKLFRKKEIKELLAFYEHAINERNGNALLKISEHPYMNMPAWLMRDLRKTKECYMYLHDWFKMDSRDPYQELVEAYEHDKIVVLDVESTGLCTTKDDIVQIAAIVYGKKGVIKKLDILVKPTQSVGDSYVVHGFSDEQLAREGLEPEEALDILTQFVQDYVIVGHNINYDMQIINSMMSRYQKSMLVKNRVYDTLDLAYKVYPKLPNHKLDTLSKL
ncbi:MAG: UvrD-helicase domain-containing protein, partial [Cellulosilyticum sp.]|nr:UvrD-helicase domain-containing protein [Cellulosilyticum sp.]